MTQEHLLWLRNYLTDLYKTPILENFLGLEVLDLAEGKASFSMKVKEAQGNIYGFVHGGTMASISDIAMGVSCLTFGKRVVTIDMNISFIRNTHTGSTLAAVGEVISNGKTIMRTEAKIFDEQQQLLATAQASYFVTGEYRENDHP
jgi:acyl-CoA thioesterase